MNTPKPLSVKRTPTGYTTEFSTDELRAFLADNPPPSFKVEGLPVSIHTDLMREALDTSPRYVPCCPSPHLPQQSQSE